MDLSGASMILPQGWNLRIDSLPSKFHAIVRSLKFTLEMVCACACVCVCVASHSSLLLDLSWGYFLSFMYLFIL